MRPMHRVFSVYLVCLLGSSRAQFGPDTEYGLLLNYQNLQDYMFTSMKEARRNEMKPIDKVHVKTPDATLIVDLMEKQDGSASWFRARGIQYGEHPIGPLRWQPPVPYHETSMHPVDATKWGDDCVQGPFTVRMEGILDAEMSESCLYLNVWAPASPGNYPVLLWFHGGSFTMGGSTAYSADSMMNYRSDMIVVTANYRLGPFGWLCGKAVAKNTTDGSCGNFGLQDTRLAMKWVQRNIASFGGDPSRVTIYGESSGASMVETHLTAPRSNGLFNSAIMQSGAFDNYTVQVDTEYTFVDFAKQAGCDPKAADVLECLRSLPVFTKGDDGKFLMPAIGNTSNLDGYGPCVDGVELLETPLESAQGKRLNNVSAAILGVTKNEGNYLMPIMMPMPNNSHASLDDLQVWLKAYYTGIEDNVTKQYQDEIKSLTPWQVASAIYTDSQYLCPTFESARWLDAVGAKTYVYRLEYAPSTYIIDGELTYRGQWCQNFHWCKNVSGVATGVGHSADVHLVWNEPGMNATDYIVAHRMVDYWVNFAASGNPSGEHSPSAALPPWPTYSPGNSTMSLRPASSAEHNLRQSYCEFWANANSGLPPPVNHQKINIPTIIV